MRTLEEWAVRAQELLRAATGFIDRNPIKEYTTFYDEAICDGYCLMEECKQWASLMPAAPDRENTLTVLTRENARLKQAIKFISPGLETSEDDIVALRQERAEACKYILELSNGQIGYGDHPLRFLIASHAAINQDREELLMTVKRLTAELTRLENK